MEPRNESRTERPGRPDRYVDLSKSRGLAEDQRRKQAAADEQRRLRTTDRIPKGTLRVRFGDQICRRCDGTGGSLLEACVRCQGTGISA